MNNQANPTMEPGENRQPDQTRHLYPRIASKPGILFGKPVIEGTRLSVEVLLESISRSDTFEEILEDYPFLTHEDILAAIAYASSASLSCIHDASSLY